MFDTDPFSEQPIVSFCVCICLLWFWYVRLPCFFFFETVAAPHRSPLKNTTRFYRKKTVSEKNKTGKTKTARIATPLAKQKDQSKQQLSVSNPSGCRRPALIRRISLPDRLLKLQHSRQQLSSILFFLQGGPQSQVIAHSIYYSCWV